MRHIVCVLAPPSGALIVKWFRDPVPSHPTEIWGKSCGHDGKYLGNLEEIMGK